MSEDRRIGAAIDVGSNSVHLLVVAIEGPQRRVLRDESELLGLGAVVDMEGRIPDDTADAVVELKIVADHHDVAGAEFLCDFHGCILLRAASKGLKNRLF